MTAPTTLSELRPPRYGLAIARTDEGNDAVVRLAGVLELATTALVREELRRALATTCERVVVDLRPVEFLDSTGIHALVEAHDRCRSSRRSLTLLLECGPVHRTLDACGVLEILDHTSPEAIAA